MKNLNKMKIAGDMQFEIGQDKVSHFPSMDVKDDETLLNRLLAMKRSTFDSSKFTVVGSPTITDDGIASGFSTSNYLSIDVLSSLTSTNKFKIYTKFRLNTLDTIQAIWGCENKLRLIYNSSTNSIDLRYVTANTTWISSLLTSNNLNIEVGVDYFVCVEYDGNYINLLTSTDGVNYIRQNRRAESFGIDGISPFFIGANSLSVSGANLPLTYGQIDLKSFSITVDGEEVFNGNKTGIDIIKSDNYGVVGSPTITDDGIATMSTELTQRTNRVLVEQVTPQDLKGHSWEILGKVYSKDVSLKASFNILSIGLGRGAGIIYSTNTNVWRNIASTGTTDEYKDQWTIGDIELDLSKYEYITFNYSYDFNTKLYKVVLETPDGIQKIVNKTAQTSNPELYNINEANDVNKKFYIGSAYTGYDSMYPIDLNSFKIYVDGNLVYQPCLKIPYTESKTGSKIVNAIYRDRVIDLYEQYGYTHYYTLGDTDFTLATCKGSDVVESGENYEQTADLTLKQWGSATNGQTVNLLPYKDTNYVVTLTNGSKTKNSFVANATGDYLAVGKTVLG